MKIKAIVIEDEKNNVELLKHFISKYCKDIEVAGDAARVDEGIDLIREVNPQIIFLDIRLEQGTGFDVLDEIKDTNTHVIFITAYDEYAIKAFKYSAIDYLMKPVQIDQLIAAVDRAKAMIDQESNIAQLKMLVSELKDDSDQNDSIAISMIDRVEIIKFSSILSIEADGKYSSFHVLDNKRIVSSTNLGEYEKLLSEKKQFVRVHNSFIVNTSEIQSIIKKDGAQFCVMSDNTEVPISRRKREKIQELIKK